MRPPRCDATHNDADDKSEPEEQQPSRMGVSGGSSVQTEDAPKEEPRSWDDGGEKRVAPRIVSMTSATYAWPGGRTRQYDNAISQLVSYIMGPPDLPCLPITLRPDLQSHWQ